MKNKPMKNAIVRFLNGDLSETEKVNFEQWLNEDPENRKSLEEVKKIWIHSEKMANFQTIDAKKDWIKIKNRINFEGNRSMRNPSSPGRKIWLVRVAAILILFLGFGSLAKQFVFQSPDIITITTGDFKNDMVLPDGSRVFLNKYSEIKYPEKFKRKNRQVELKGEAYFEVTPNPEKLFRINVNNIAGVEVLGTSFNLKLNSELGSVELQVASGRVAFFTPETQSNKLILIKNEGASFRDGSISKVDLKNKNFLSWKTGILSFENENIEYVFKDLSNYYNKQFIIKELNSADLIFTSRFDNENLESVLEEISLVLDLNYIIAGDSIFFSNVE